MIELVILTLNSTQPVFLIRRIINCIKATEGQLMTSSSMRQLSMTVGLLLSISLGKSIPAKRAVFDIIPRNSDTSHDTKAAGNPCECPNNWKICIWDNHQVCRRTFRKSSTKETRSLEARILKKHRHKLQKLFKKWLKQELATRRQNSE